MVMVRKGENELHDWIFASFSFLFVSGWVLFFWLLPRFGMSSRRTFVFFLGVPGVSEGGLEGLLRLLIVLQALLRLL